MSGYLFRHCALSYLNQWYRTDSKHLATMAKDSDSNHQGQALRKLASKYMVARCFPTAEIKKSEGEDGVSRFWARVAKASRRPKLRSNSSPTTVADAVHGLAGNLGLLTSPKGNCMSDPLLLSAASKFLWFRGCYGVRIYDKRAVVALNGMTRAAGEAKGKWRVDGNYLAFYQAWQREFNAWESELDNAIAELPVQLSWSMIPTFAYEKATKIIQSPWFRDRVFDKYLWTVGEAKGGGASSFT